MKQEEKELLLKDLCARLPYGVMAEVEQYDTYDLLHPKTFVPENIKLSINNIHRFDSLWKNCKPYLRPMSSMSEEEANKLGNVMFNFINGETYHTDKQTDWLNAHHFDYRGLIEKGLAIEAPEGMYKEN